MGKTFAVFLLVIALAGGGYYYYDTQLSSSFLKKKEVTINGKEYDVRSKEGLDRLGLKLRMIANKDNAAILYCKASNAWDEPEGHVKDALSKCNVTDPTFKRWYEKNKECLALIHRAARKKDCQFPILGKDDDPAAAMFLPHLGPMRAFAWLLRCEAKLLQQKGDWSAALDCCAVVYRMTRHICRSDKPSVSIMIAIALQAVAGEGVEQCIANGDPAEAALEKALQDCQQALESMPSCASVIATQRRLIGPTSAQTEHHLEVIFARGRAQMGGVAIFAAIKLYEKKNGRPPSALSELEGDYISKLPKDPFSGRDYVYKVRGNDWILYSVWDNLTDDGGAGSWPHKVSADRDLIWRNTRLPVD